MFGFPLATAWWTLQHIYTNVRWHNRQLRNQLNCSRPILHCTVVRKKHFGDTSTKFIVLPRCLMLSNATIWRKAESVLPLTKRGLDWKSILPSAIGKPQWIQICNDQHEPTYNAQTSGPHLCFQHHDPHYSILTSTLYQETTDDNKSITKDKASFTDY